ncbi:MAG: TonB family protein [Bacteroidota bacterium]
MLKTYINIALLFTALSIFSSKVFAQIASNKHELNAVTILTENTYVIPPKPLNYAEVVSSIKYPTICRKQGIEGKVIAKILVGKDGKAKEHKIIQEVQKDLANAYKEKITDLKFEPARDVAGNAIERWVVIPLHFRLNI